MTPSNATMCAGKAVKAVQNKWRRRESNVEPLQADSQAITTQPAVFVGERDASAPRPGVPEGGQERPGSIGQRPDSARLKGRARYQPGVPKKGRWLRATDRAIVPEHGALKRAIARCTDPANKDFDDYGGRGIAVHPGWMSGDGYDLFMDHIGPRPGPGYTLGRILNDRGYEPGNVRWETWTEQQNNRRSNHLISIDGVTKSAADWARSVGLPRRQVVTNRIGDGWHPTAAVHGHMGERKRAAHARLGLDPARETVYGPSSFLSGTGADLDRPVRQRARPTQETTGKRRI